MNSSNEVQILMSTEAGSAVWGAVYMLPSEAYLPKRKEEMVVTHVSLFERDENIGWFGNESEAAGTLYLTGEVGAFVIVGGAQEGGGNGGEDVVEDDFLIEEEKRSKREMVEMNINKGIVELELDVDFVEEVLRKWIPRPKGPVGVYW